MSGSAGHEPGFRFQHANRLDRLADAAADLIRREQAAAPLVPVDVVVAHPGVGTWLRQRLAGRHGAAANLRFLQPTELVWELAETMLGAQAVRPARFLDPEAMALGLYHALGSLPDEPGLRRLRRYLERAGGVAADPARPRLGLALELGRLFREYAIYRPAWIAAWSAGDAAGPDHDDAVWQRWLWQAFWERARGSDGATLDPGAVLTRLATEALPPGPPLLLFGLAHLPPVFLAVLARAAETRAVHLFMPNPCEEYWAYEQDERRTLRGRVRALVAGQETPEVVAEPVNELLASLGRLGQEFLLLVSDHLVDQLPHGEEVAYVDREGGGRLAVVQRALRHLDLPPPARPRADDPSIQVHACHSPLREVEVLHDRVLEWLDPAGPFAGRYGPRDILVLAPDIDVYAPHVRAVFGAELPGLGRLPFNLSDRKPLDEHPLVQTFLALLDLPTSDFEAEAVMSLLETPAVARRFGLDETDCLELRRAVGATRTHWGIDAQHRAARGGAAEGGNSWRHGLDRLLFGYACSHDEPLAIGGFATLPWTGIEGQAAEAVGKLALFVALLDGLRRALTEAERTPGRWQALLAERILDDLVELDPADRREQAAEQAIRGALDALRSAATRSGVASEPLPWVAVRELLRSHLTGALAQRRFLSRGITFANTVPLRAVPARIVCLLGMNGGEFPRAEGPRSFDLLVHDRRAGDRSRREEDRYLFLESLLAAEDIFYVSHVGRDQQENRPRDPSPVVSELLDLLVRIGLRLEPVVHPLQPFSPRYFGACSAAGRAAEPPRSYQAHWVPAAEASARGVAQPAPARFADPPAALPGLPPPAGWPEAIRLATLARGLVDLPARYLRDTLGLRLRDEALHLPDDFAGDGLALYQLRQRAVEAALAHGGTLPPESELPSVRDRLEGWLPPGRRGRLQLEKQFAGGKLDKLVGTVLARWPAGRSAVAVDLKLAPPGGAGGLRLVGRVEDVAAGALWRWSAGQLHGRRMLHYLVEGLAEGAATGEALALRAVGADGKLVVLGPLSPDEAGARLGDLAGLYLRAAEGPLPFFPKLAWTVVREAADEAALETACEAFFLTEGESFRTAEQGDSDYYALLTRGWEPGDLLNAPFREAADLVFGWLDRGGDG